MKLTYLRHLLVFSAVLFISACSSLPPELNSASENVITDYKTWVSSDSNNASEVRLGGVIASVTNLKDKTRVEVVNVPIDSIGRPSMKVEPKGRFVGYIDGFLDPVTYAQGRLITLIGVTAKPEAGKVGESEQQFPVMTVKGYHLWRIEERVIMNDIGSSIYPCRSFYCRADRDEFYREGRVIQEVK